MRKFDPYLLANAQWYKIRNRILAVDGAKRNYSSVNARLIPTATIRTVYRSQ